MLNVEEINKAIENKEFYFVYLPIIDLKTGRCCGAEALIRWHKPDGTIVMPDDFIPKIEQTSSAGLLTYWAIEHLGDVFHDWLKAHSDFKLSINIPPELFGRGGVAYAVIKSKLYAFLPQLVFEMTERGLPDEVGANAIVDAVNKGINVALDDATFLNGANLLIYARCHFNYVKLDRSLIEQIQEGQPRPSWLDLLTAVNEQMHAVVIAEGIQTQEQLSAVRNAKVPQAQGFYFSKPINFDDMCYFYQHADFMDYKQLVYTLKTIK